MSSLESKIIAIGKSVGLSQVGISTLPSDKYFQIYNWWLGEGYAAGMEYMHRQKERRSSLKKIMPNVESVVVCLLRFPGQPEKPLKTENSVAMSKLPIAIDPKRGKIARYACTKEDYHYFFKDMLLQFEAKLHEQLSQEFASKAYVDTGAIPERTLGVLAGLGWIGKNAMLIHPEEGSWFWIGEILTSLKLSAASTLVPDRCGKCRKCIDACPTEAIVEGKRAVDSRKCLAYYNIEHRGEIPNDIATKMGEWLLGCDICQEVCPWNQHSLKKARQGVGPPQEEWIDPKELLALNEQEYQLRYKRRAHSRPKLAGLQRNAKILLEKK